MRTALGAVPVALLLAVALYGCGSTHNTSTAPAPAEPDAPATGSLRTFTYEDTVAPHLLDPFKEANPDLDVKTATFDSDFRRSGPCISRNRAWSACSASTPAHWAPRYATGTR